MVMEVREVDAIALVVARVALWRSDAQGLPALGVDNLIEIGLSVVGGFCLTSIAGIRDLCRSRRSRFPISILSDRAARHDAYVHSAA